MRCEGRGQWVAAFHVALLASPAAADLTAEDVLADQLNMLSGYGLIEMTTTGTTASADGLVVDSFLGRFKDGDTRVELTLGGVTLVEQGDGSVAVIYPDELIVAMQTAPAGEEPKIVSVAIEFQNISHIVSGYRDDITHAIAFNRVALGDVLAMPSDVPVEATTTVAFEGADVTARFVSGDAPRRQIAFALAGITMAGDLTFPQDDLNDVERVAYELLFTGAEGNIGYLGSGIPQHSLELGIERFNWRQQMEGASLEAVDLTVLAEDFELAYDIAMSPEELAENPLQALEDGQRADLTMRSGPSAYQMDMRVPEGPLSMSSSSETGDATIRIGEDGFAMAASSQNTRVEMSGNVGPDVAFDNLGYSIGNSEIAFAFPLIPSEEAAPFAIRLAVEQFEMGDMIWSLFDPGQRLPRDPADLVIEIDGTAVLSENPLSETASDMPFRQTEARLNALRLSMVGAELTGSGQGRDTSTDAGPNGTGSVNLMLTGGHTLIDTLIEMGLHAEEQAMGARMGLGLIARPGDGVDTLVSEIEVREDGSIMANGQRIK